LKNANAFYLQERHMGVLTFANAPGVDLINPDFSDLFDDAADIISFSSTEIIAGIAPASANYVYIFSGSGFTVDGNGDITGGVVTGVRGEDAGVFDFELTGANIDAVTLVALANAADAGGLLALMLAGNDSITGTSFADALAGIDGADTINAGGGNDTVRGGLGDDSISGGNDADKLFGDDGRDTLRGDGGADKLFGGGGNDKLFGGGGNDSLFGNANSDLLDGGTGNDAFRGYGGNDRLFGGAGADSLLGHTGNDIINGGNQGDILDAGAGNDQLFGDAGNDTLFGRAGNDTLKGGGGGDAIFGGTGADRITGGAGDDTLIGNGGNDFFILAPGDDADVITDFTAGAGSQDVIDLSAMGAAFDTFAEVQAAASDDGFGNTVIDFGGGDIITLTGVAVADLHQDDFLFI
jgi:Ca2+-binding RTX toxin-like protein